MVHFCIEIYRLIFTTSLRGSFIVGISVSYIQIIGTSGDRVRRINDSLVSLIVLFFVLFLVLCWRTIFLILIIVVDGVSYGN